MTGGGSVLKKLFADASVRGTGVGRRLYERLLAEARAYGTRWIVLDTPSVATASHRFYERAGFQRSEVEALPFPYEFPDRGSLLYVLDVRAAVRRA